MLLGVFLKKCEIYKIVRFITLSFFIFILTSEPSFAQDFSSISNALDKVVAALTGPLGTAIAVLAITAVGITFMMGKMDWMFAAAIVIGIAIMFGGASIVEGFSFGGTVDP